MLTARIMPAAGGAWAAAARLDTSPAPDPNAAALQMHASLCLALVLHLRTCFTPPSMCRTEADNKRMVLFLVVGITAYLVLALVANWTQH